MIRDRLSDFYYHRRGEREISAGLASALFDTSRSIYTGTTARSVRKFYRTEHHVVLDLVDELASDDVVYDIGAHIGFYSCLAADIVTDGGVVAFEPDGRDHDALLANVERNHPERISHHAVLLSDENGCSPFLGGSMADGEGEMVDVWRLDDYRRREGLPEPTVVKLDIEGAELRALEGSVESLESVRVCYIEAHVNEEYDRSMHRFGDTEDDLRQFLGERGFATTELGRRRNEVHLKAVSERD